MKSLIEPRSDRDLQNIKTQPGPAGPDPTLSTIIKFKIGMPIGELYSPVMPCYVTDQIFQSFDIGSRVGVFNLHLGEIMNRYSRQTYIILL